MRIKQIVNKLIKKHGTNDPFLIADQRHVLVYDRPLGGILGFFTANRHIPMIYLNADVTEPVHRFVCAHELGHSVLHPHLNTPFLRQNTLFSIDRVEREANTFGVELLMPDNELYEYRESGITIHEVATIYGIPPELSELKSLDTYWQPLLFYT